MVLMGLLISPLLVLAYTFFRALVLFWPTMILLGAVHSYIPMVPSLGWQATFLLVALLTLLIPHSSGVKSN